MNERPLQFVKPRVFISYTDKDGSGKRFARAFREVLLASGYDDVFFFDHSSTSSLGQLLWEDSGIPSEIKRRDILVLICTRDIVLSRPATREFNLALVMEKMVVPLRHDSAQIPLALLPEFRESFDDDNYQVIFHAVARKLPESYASHLKDQILTRNAIAALEVSPEETQTTPKQGELNPG